MIADSAPPYMPLQGKTVLFGISGGIAALRAVDYARGLMKMGARVVPVMTDAARRFVSPMTVTALTGEQVWSNMFDQEEMHTIPHINLARKADVVAVVPATADFIARSACGMANDLLSTLLLSFCGPVVICPSMNPAMFSNKIVQKNIEILRRAGFTIVAPGIGKTACGEEGEGRLAEWHVVREEITRALTRQDMTGVKVLVTAGPTREAIDPVRYISNRSSGRMGFAVVQAAFRRGADVTLVSGPVHIPFPHGVHVIKTESSVEMAEIVKKMADRQNVIIMSAAVSDYRPSFVSRQKIKKSEAHLCLHMEKTEDILASLRGIVASGTFLAGFCAETENLHKNAKEKLEQKKLDLIVANDVSACDAGFDVPDNRVIIFDRYGYEEALPLLNKEEVADRILDRIVERIDTSQPGESR